MKRSEKNLEDLRLRMDQERPIYDPLPTSPLRGKTLKAAVAKRDKTKAYCEKKLAEYLDRIRTAGPKELHYRHLKPLIPKLEMFVRSDHPKMRGSVVVNHEDGSHFFFNYAWYEEVGGWIIVFTEHQGTHAFATDDLSFWSQTECTPA